MLKARRSGIVNTIKRIPFGVKMTGLILAMIIGFVYGGIKIHSCSINDRDRQVIGAVQTDYDCPSKNIKVNSVTDTPGGTLVYYLSVCGVNKRYKCETSEGCRLKKCWEIAPKRKKARKKSKKGK